MDTAGVIQLCILVILIMLSAFFSSAETALTTLSLVKVRSMAEESLNITKDSGQKKQIDQCNTDWQ